MMHEFTDKRTTELLESNGAFFAFSNRQFDEAKKEGVTYVNMGMGLIAPKENADAVFKGLEKIHKEARESVLAKYDKEEIIRYELANHEAYYTGSIDDAYGALEHYGFTREEVLAVYRVECRKEENWA